MAESADTLAEACKVAGIVTGEEVEIEMLEKQIADVFRATCLKIFSESKFRMPTHLVAIEYDDRDGVEVWEGVGVTLVDNVWYSNIRRLYLGSVQTLRVRRDGTIVTVWQHVDGDTSPYDGPFGRWNFRLPGDRPSTEEFRLATDHEIAANAVELASDLLAVLKKRIDTAKDEKTELRRIAGLGEKE
ncbi:MAG: hypothetical protein PHI67_08705 [Candidatus Methanomethylophilaceae archaeon]|nr:hypothetical protein [Candidatus Methanomethylophilaceae archaeon]